MKTKSENLSTVNVVEAVDGVIQYLRAFPDDKLGNHAAQNLFM